MKTQTYYNSVFILPCRLTYMVSTGMIVIFCLLASLSFSQAFVITSPSANTTYKLPDPAGVQTLTELQGAITTTELAGKALNTDAANERAALTSAEHDFYKSKTMRTDYLAGLDNYTKNGYDPYMVDYNTYTPDVTKYGEVLARHNTATDASNALAPKNRNTATVASLNSEKAELDSWHARLETFKASLDAAKAKLDAQRETLLQQKKEYETAYQTSTNKLKVSRIKLKDILDQLILCSYYADKCKTLLVSKFNYTGTSDAGYFGSSVYKGALTDLNTDLEKLKDLSGMEWDGN
jgi:hypothetical protein